MLTLINIFNNQNGFLVHTGHILGLDNRFELLDSEHSFHLLLFITKLISDLDIPKTAYLTVSE